MRRVKDEFLKKLEAKIPLAGMTVAEIGCGDGYYSAQIARRCAHLTALDPDGTKLQKARKIPAPNAKFLEGCAQSTGLMDVHFDVTMFTLSFHHLFPSAMPRAIREAVRITKPKGRIIFLEPGVVGSFFEAEIYFDACDGDERGLKAAAYRAMNEHPNLEPLCEFCDETVFHFSGVRDFMSWMKPKKNIRDLKEFLESRQFTLTAKRRVNIYKPRV